MRRPDGVVVIAGYQFIAGFLCMCVGYIALGIAALGGATAPEPWWMAFFWGGMGALLFVLGAFAILAGIGLLRMRRWARWSAVAIALLTLPVFPVGTIIGVVILWYLLRDSVGQQFDSGAI